MWLGMTLTPLQRYKSQDLHFLPEDQPDGVPVELNVKRDAIVGMLPDQVSILRIDAFDEQKRLPAKYGIHRKAAIRVLGLIRLHGVDERAGDVVDQAAQL